jgi:GeoRSP system SPASM domain protein
MAIDLLDTPLRVTWDLHDESGAAAPATVRRVAEELVAAGVFFVTLERQPFCHPIIPEILTTLQAGGCRTSVVSRGTAAERAFLVNHPRLDTLFLDLHPFVADGAVAWDALQGCLAAFRDIGQEPAFLLVPTRFSLPLIPDLLSFCRQASVNRFKLPNTRVGDNFDPPSARLRPEDVEAFRLQVGNAPAALHAGLALEVHDLFLWEILFPGRQEGRSEYGGCQAGNSLAHVDAAGELYPCSSWPERLGSLQQHSLIELWQSSRRLRIIKEIAATPAGCISCHDLALCLGGCRGRGRLLNQAGGCRDPFCRSPRH